MTDTSALGPAFAALDDCDSTLIRLEKMCCEPGRSPRMRRLAETLAAARVAVGDLAQDGEHADVMLQLESAGAQLGSLQVGCCAPSRLPLYAGMLESLTTIQLAVNRAEGTGH